MFTYMCIKKFMVSLFLIAKKLNKLYYIHEIKLYTSVTLKRKKGKKVHLKRKIWTYKRY